MNKALDLTGGNATGYTGSYVDGTLYAKGTIVQVDGWLMIANKHTSEYPAPQPTGDAYDLLTGTLTDESVSAKQVLFGNRYTASQDIYINSKRVNVVAGNHYEVYKVHDPIASPKLELIHTFTADITGWMNLGGSQELVSAGTTLDLVVKVNEPDVTPTTWSGNWNYIKPQNEDIPLAGQAVHSSKAVDRLSISHTDSDGGDRTAILEALTIGDIINLGTGSWSIQSIVEQVGYIVFTVSPAAQYATTGIQEFTYETVTATPITYPVEVDGWLGEVGVSGLFIVDGSYSDIVQNDNAYGIDFEVQNANIPVDWDPLSAPEGGSVSTQTYGDYYYQKESNFVVPNAYNVTDCELSVDMPAGTYEIAYAFEVDFTGTKDKALLTQLTGTWAGAEFYDSMGTSSIGNLKTRYYSFPKVWDGGVMTHGIRFKDDQGSNGFIVNFVDVVVKRVQ